MKLFEPIKIGNVELKNRVIMAPMENGMAEVGTGEVTDRIIAFFEERAQHNIAMIMPGSIGVSPEGRGLPTQLSLFDEKQVAGHKRLVDAIHSKGSLVAAQLYHAGRQASEAITGLDPLAPSAIPCGILQNHPKEITHEQMDRIKEQFRQAARWSIEAGYDIVEVHFAHGYLLHSFMSTHTNHRTDEYGGTLENRMRFTLECIEAIKKNVPDTMPVLVKFTPHQRVEGFRTIDEGIEMAKILEKAGVDALHVDTGCYEEWFQAITTVYSKEGYKLDIQKAIKDIVSVPVLGDGNLKDPEVAKKAVEDGILDYVGIAHQMLADPYWPKKVKTHHEEDIAPCVGCNECLLAGFSGKHYYCAVNPLCYAEKAYALPLPNGQKRNVLVIGGGPAGMMAAITAKRRGFDVDLYEKEDKLGGTLWPAGGPDFKADVLKLIKYLETQCQKLGVNIHLNTAITKDNLEGDYDKVILAAGSTPAMPPIPGIDTTVLASDYLTHQATVGK